MRFDHKDVESPLRLEKLLLPLVEWYLVFHYSGAENFKMREQMQRAMRETFY